MIIAYSLIGLYLAVIVVHALLRTAEHYRKELLILKALEKHRMQMPIPMIERHYMTPVKAYATMNIHPRMMEAALHDPGQAASMHRHIHHSLIQLLANEMSKTVEYSTNWDDYPKTPELVVTATVRLLEPPDDRYRKLDLMAIYRKWYRR